MAAVHGDAALLTAEGPSDDEHPPRAHREESEGRRPAEVEPGSGSTEESTADQEGAGTSNAATSSTRKPTSEHCHAFRTPAQRDRRAERVLIAVSCLTVAFVIAEFAGGVLAHSIAIMTDAGHMLSDLLGFVISITAIRCSRRTASKRLSFGWERAEVLGALLSVIIIWILTTTLIMMSIDRISRGDYDVEPDIMLITAGVGLLFNIIMAAILHFGHYGHSHLGAKRPKRSENEPGEEGGKDKAKTDASPVAARRRNLNVRAALIHVMGDLIQSIGVLIAALIIKFTNWHLADPICTFLFAIIVLFSSLAVIRDIFYVLMEATPKHIDYSMLRADLEALDGVRAVHNLHVWSLNMDKTALSVHLAIDDPLRALETMEEAGRVVRTKHDIELSTIQVELFEAAMDDCDFCLPVED